MFCLLAPFRGAHGEPRLVSSGPVVVKACRAGPGHNWGRVIILPGNLHWALGCPGTCSCFLETPAAVWTVTTQAQTAFQGAGLPLQEGADPSQGVRGWGRGACS